MSVESADRAAHSASNQVLLCVDVDDGVNRGLEDLGDDRGKDDGFDYDGLSASFEPVYGGGLLVSAHVAAKGDELDGWELQRGVRGFVYL